MLSEADIREIADQVSRRLRRPRSNPWFFEEMTACIDAAVHAQKLLAALSREERSRLIQSFRDAALLHAPELAAAEYQETGYGRVADKLQKCRLAATATMGMEEQFSDCTTAPEGLLEEAHVPYGVIGATTPSTNPAATIISNAISMVAAGNTVVFAAHPAAGGCSNRTLDILNQAAIDAGAPAPVLFAVNNPDAAQREILLTDPRVPLINITGGGHFAARAMRSGKRIIAAGPGNPPCIVDETADLEQAAAEIVTGASFENNIMCISEKEIFVVEPVGEALIAALERAHAQMMDAAETERLLRCVTIEETERFRVNRAHIGKSAPELLRLAGIPVRGEPEILITRTDRDHPFVQLEMMMPIVPVVFVPDARTAIAAAVEAEHGFHHTATIFSRNEEIIRQAAAALQTTIFVVNGSSLDGAGAGPLGYCSFTLATTTGEGFARPRHYTRLSRRLKKGGVF